MSEPQEILEPRIQLSSKEEEIVAYISKRELELQEESQKKIEQEVLQIYGDDGYQLFKNLSEQFESMVSDCPECGKDAPTTEEPFDNTSEEQILDAADFYLETFEGAEFKMSDMATILALVKDTSVESVKEEEVKTMASMIVFRGLTEGWLLDRVITQDIDAAIDPDGGMKQLYRTRKENQKNENKI
jgi:hypothetical protein